MIQQRLTHNFFKIITLGFFGLFLFFLLFGQRVDQGFFTLLTFPALLQTDYFELAGLAATFLNSGLVLSLVLSFLTFNEHQYTGDTMGNLFLLMGYSFFGKNPLNAFPFLLGHQLFIFNHPQHKVVALNNAIVSTTLGPVVSLFLFQLNWPWWVVLILTTGIGYLFTPCALALKKLHGGLTLYNSGFTAGIIAIIINILLRTSGTVLEPNHLNQASFSVLLGLLFCFSVVLFGLGWFKKSKPCHQIKNDLDYFKAHGLYYCWYNMGLIGFILCVFLWLSPAPLNGISIGSAFSVIGFGAYGKKPQSVLILMTTTFLGLWIQGMPFDSVTFVNIIIFSTALSPVAYKHSVPLAILAGALHSLITPQTSVLQGYLNLCNNGFASGVVAVLIYTFTTFIVRKEQGDKPAIDQR